MTISKSYPLHYSLSTHPGNFSNLLFKYLVALGNVLSIWKEQWIIWNAQTNKLVQGILARSGKLDVHYAVDYSNKSSMYYFVIFLDIRKMQIMILDSCCNIQMSYEKNL